jgi:hypothetical protein
MTGRLGLGATTWVGLFGKGLERGLEVRVLEFCGRLMKIARYTLYTLYTRRT